MQHVEVGARHRDDVAVGEEPVGGPVAVHVPPELVVVAVDPDRRVDGGGEVDGRVHVVVVPVGADDGDDAAAGDGLGDRPVVVGGVDDDDLVVVADEPDVVVDVEALAVEGELPARDDALDPGAHRTTTERRTSPWCIFSNARSTSPMPMVSVTKPSRSSSPRW